MTAAGGDGGPASAEEPGLGPRRDDQHRPARLGVYGGTFDPVHIGHMAVAVNVRHALRLDRLLMVVANVPWQKVGVRVLSPAEDRLAMVMAAVEGLEGVEASRLELDRGGPSYTADTLGT